MPEAKLSPYLVQLRYKSISLAWTLLERSVGDVLEKITELVAADDELIMAGGPGEPDLTIEIRRV